MVKTWLHTDLAKVPQIHIISLLSNNKHTTNQQENNIKALKRLRMRRLLVIDPLSAPNLALRSDLVMFDLLECKYDRNASRNHFYKLQVLGFLWFSSQKLTLCSYSHFFLSSLFCFSSTKTSQFSWFQNAKSPKVQPFSLPLLPLLNYSHPLTHSPKCRPATPLYSTMSPTAKFERWSGLVVVGAAPNADSI